MHKDCVLITDCDHFLAQEAISLCKSHFHRVAVFDDGDQHIAEGIVAAVQECDLLISFLNECILTPEMLQCPNINFHPGPPEYPGRGGASYALYDRAKTYGATAHVMAEHVDSGAIVLVDEFDIAPYTRCETLFARAELSCLELLAKALHIFSTCGKVPPPNGRTWRGKSGTRKQFVQWLMLNPANPETFRRKAAAAYHSKFPGPYVTVHGLKFDLVKDQQNVATLSQPFA
jgi:methionyl-tRNA formyltransferase